jgi:hypothetical protein
MSLFIHAMARSGAYIGALELVVGRWKSFTRASDRLLRADFTPESSR